MMTTEAAIPEDVAARLLDLIIAHQRPEAEEFQLPAGSRETLAAWLKRILVNGRMLREHRLFVNERLQHGYRFQMAPGEEELSAIVEQGTDASALTDRLLAELLLNPVALYTLYEAIEDRVPQWWEEPLLAESRELVEELQMELPRFEPLEPRDLPWETRRPQVSALDQYPMEDDLPPDPGRPKGADVSIPPADSRCHWIKGNPGAVRGSADFWFEWDASAGCLKIRAGGFLIGGTGSRESVRWNRGVETASPTNPFSMEFHIKSSDGSGLQSGDTVELEWENPADDQHVVITVTME